MERGETQRQVLLLALRAGKILLENGAEIFRVEDTVHRICKYYGLKSTNVFTLSNGLFLTNGDETESQFAKVIQTPVNYANFRRVIDVNELSRGIEQGLFTIEKANQELDKIENNKGLEDWKRIGVAGISAACFSHLFGGDWKDFACSLLIGMILYGALVGMRKLKLSKMVTNLFASMWLGFLCIVAYKMELASQLEPLMIGCIMLLVPGIAFTNGVRDLAHEDYIGGAVRMLDAMLVFLCIAIGVGLAFSSYSMITGGRLL